MNTNGEGKLLDETSAYYVLQDEAIYLEDLVRNIEGRLVSIHRRMRVELCKLRKPIDDGIVSTPEDYGGYFPDTYLQ